MNYYFPILLSLLKNINVISACHEKIQEQAPNGKSEAEKAGQNKDKGCRERGSHSRGESEEQASLLQNTEQAAVSHGFHQH